MHRANLIAHILGKTKDTKRCFTIKNQRLTKDIRKPFYFNYITSQARRTALFTKILREIRCISTLQKECKSNATGS